MWSFSSDSIFFIVFMVSIIIFSLFFPLFSSTLQIKKKREFMTDNNYEIKEIPDFLTSEECDLIMKLSSDKLETSRVYSSDADLVSDVRKSEQCWLKDDVDDLIKKISLRIAEITETEMKDQEEFQVVKYPPGGYYRAHYDACDWRKEDCSRFEGDRGTRFITFIIYLNDNFEGGETYFPNIDKKVSPKKGKAAIFYDTGEDGVVLDKSLHGGLDVANGEKWICNKWIRRKVEKSDIESQ